MVIGDQAPEDDDAGPDDERQDRQHLDGQAGGHGVLAVRFVAAMVPIATSAILSQKENVMSSRTGSPITMSTPVARSSQSDPVSQGAKRLAVCRNV